MKQKLNRILSLFLVLSLALGLFPASAKAVPNAFAAGDACFEKVTLIGSDSPLPYEASGYLNFWGTDVPKYTVTVPSTAESVRLCTGTDIYLGAYGSGYFSTDGVATGDGEDWDPAAIGSSGTYIIETRLSGQEKNLSFVKLASFVSSPADGYLIEFVQGTLLPPSAAPIISVNLESTPAAYMMNATAVPLAVTASGTALTYQWLKSTVSASDGFVKIDGATASSYIPSTDSTAVGTTWYKVIVTNLEHEKSPTLQSSIAACIQVTAPTGTVGVSLVSTKDAVFTLKLGNTPIVLPSPTVADGYASYLAYLAPGVYAYEAFAAEEPSRSLGSGILTITDAAQQVFSFSLLFVYPQVGGWTGNVDFTAELRDSAQRVMAAGTPHQGGLSYGYLPYMLPADATYSYVIAPTAKKTAEGYRDAATGSVTTRKSNSYSTVSQKLYKTSSVRFTIPTGASLSVRSGAAGYGSGALPVCTPVHSSGTTAHTYDLRHGSTYQYRVSAPDKVTYTQTIEMSDALVDGITITPEMLAPNGACASTLVRDLTANGGCNVADLYLNASETGCIDCSPGDTWQLVPLRNRQTVSTLSGTPNFAEPDYHFAVLDPETGAPSDAVVTADADGLLTARGAGTALVLVTYDALTAANATGGDVFFGAIWPENTGVIVVRVGQHAGPAMNMTLNAQNANNATHKLSGVKPDAELDVFYYIGDGGYAYTFLPEVGSTVTLLRPTLSKTAASYVGGFSDAGVTQNGNAFTVQLTQGRNIVKVSRNGTDSYQVLTAKKQLPPTITNLTNPGQPIQPGDRVQVMPDTVYLPVNRLTGLYRFTARIRYSDAVSGTGSDQFQSTPASRTLTFTIPANWNPETPYTLTGGTVEITGGSGGKFGDHRRVTLEGLPAISSASRSGTLGSLPDIVIPVQATKRFAVTFAPKDAQGLPITDFHAVITRDGAEVARTTGAPISLPYGDYAYTIARAGCYAQRGSFSITDAAAASQTLTPTLTASTHANPWDGAALTVPPQSGGVYQIGTGAQLAWFAAQVNRGSGAKFSAKLTADIELAGYDWTPIGGGAAGKIFQGNFDGDGHRIYNLVINARNLNNVGLFGNTSGYRIPGGVSIQNVTLASGDMNIIGGSGNCYFGALVGKAETDTKIENCVSYVNTHITSTNTYPFVGGLVGYLYGATLTRCENYGNLTSNQGFVGGLVGESATAKSAITSCSNHGDIAADGDMVGGIISSTGGSNAAVIGCSNTGAVRGRNKVGGIMGMVGSALRECCNTGSVRGEQMVGGIVGKYQSSMDISAIYNTGAVRGTDYVGGLIGQQDSATAALSCGYSTGAVSAESGKFGAVLGSAAGKLDRLYFIGLSGSAAGIGSGTPASGTVTAKSIPALQALTAAELGSSFVPDAAGGNGGYPILLWQANVTALRVTQAPDKTSYTQGDTLNPAGMVVTATVNNVPVRLDPAMLTITPTKLETLGTVLVTVGYQECTDTFPVQVHAYVPPAPSSISISTTLTDGMTQKGSRRTFDVLARDGNGDKIPPSDVVVKLNGSAIEPTWDDADKTSYTLQFTRAGENIITIRALTKTVTYTIHYTAAKPGEIVGQAVLAVEAFTLGGGYILEPQYVSVVEGENSAKLLTDALTAHGIGYRKTGTIADGFYLSALTGTALSSIDRTGNGIPKVLRDALEYSVSPRDRADSLGEFDYTQGGGWMYCANNTFPNVGFSNTYPGDGDVIRIQFTTAYGSDIGGGRASVGESGSYYPIADKDELTALLAEKGVKTAPQSALAAVQKLNATQSEVDAAARLLQSGGANGSAETPLNGSVVTLTPAVTLDKNGTFSAAVTQQDADNAVAAVKKSNAAELLIMPDIGRDASKVCVTLPKSAVDSLSVGTRAALTIASGVAKISLSGAALETIAAAQGKSVRITAERTNSGTLSPQSKVLVGDRPVFKLTIFVDDTAISQYGGAVTVTLPYTPKREENAGKLTVYCIGADGNVTEIQGAYYDGSTKSLVFQTNRLPLFAIGYNEKKIVFSDVTTQDWFYTAVQFAVTNKLFSGTDSTTFEPNTAMTRAMLLTVLYRKNGGSAVGETWYDAAVTWAQAEKISDGTELTRSVTREELATLLWRTSGSPATKSGSSLAAFDDAQTVSRWALPAMQWAHQEGLITGRTASLLAPHGSATRAEVAVILQRMMTK